MGSRLPNVTLLHWAQQKYALVGYDFMNMNSAVNAETIPEGSGTCIVVNADRHQNIMSSVALKKGVGEPWTVDRTVRFIDLLGYRESTLKSDTEPAIIAFRIRVAKMCKAAVRTEDAVKGDKSSNGFMESLNPRPSS